MSIPQDPMMLYSFINMRLRDDNLNLEQLCKELSLNREELEQKLAAAGFEYSSEHNKFW